MKSYYKWIGALGVSFLLLRGAYSVYYGWNDGFRVESVMGGLGYHPAWEVSIEEGEKIRTQEILRQSFRYLGKGGQSYAFESEDGHFVLKLLKFKLLKPRLSDRLISSLPFFEDRASQTLQRHLNKFIGLYQGYKWAYELNREGSGLIYLHFNPTYHQFGSVVLFDKMGCKHTLDLDQVVFIVQEKGRLLQEMIDEKLALGEVSSVSTLLASFFDCYLAQYKKGLYDRDCGLLHNAGFVGERPIHIDMGKLTYDEKMKEKAFQIADLQRIVRYLEKGLIKRHPQKAKDIIRNLEKTLSAYLLTDFQLENP